jgi:Na+/H+ antiporter NhaD/arsenite permease-like protein
LSKLKKSQSFAKAIKELKKDVMQDMRDRGWFAEKNNKALLILVGVIILTMVLLFLLGSSLTGISVLSGFGAIAIAAIFLALMKKKKKEGEDKGEKERRREKKGKGPVK